MKKRKILFYSFLTSFAFINLFSCNGIRSEKITLKGASSIEQGETTQLEAEVLPKETSDKKINWSTSDSSVAFVDSDGKVTGIKPGKVTITATSNSASYVKQSININIGNFIETHVENISIDNKPSEIEEGKYISLNTTISPSNADNKQITWKSSAPDIVSVSSDGVIKGEIDSITPVKITATSVDGAKVDEVLINKVIAAKKEKRALISFREPSCISNYKLKQTESEKVIDETTINRDNSASYINGNFYKNTDESFDSYKAGDKNAFKVKCIASWKDEDEAWSDYTETNPWQKCKVEVLDGSSGDYYSLNSKQNEIQFKEAAVGKSFKITVTPNEDKYSGYDTTKKEFTKVFNVEVVDGYNVYNFADLTTVDNWSTENAKKVLGDTHSIFTSNEFVDCWNETKKNNNVPTDSFHNVVLQSNIQITTADLPKYIKWTEHETDDYINGGKEAATKERFDKFVEIKTNIHQDDWKNLPTEAKRAKCRYLLNGSQKDSTAIFNRISNNKFGGNFTLQGNYFTIDITKVKPVVLFEQTTLDEYQQNATNLACLFDFGGFGDYHHKFHSCLKQGSLTELVFDEFRPYTTGGDASVTTEIKNLQIHGNSTKDVTHDEGMGGVNCVTTNIVSSFYNVLCHECSNAFYGTGSALNLTIDRCKVFDMFASFIRSYQGKQFTLTNSFFKDAGGVGVTLTEPASSEGDPETKMNITNTYMESFVSGDEIFNKNNFGHIIIKILAAIGLGAWEQYKNLNFNNNPCDHRSIVKIEEEVPKINFLIFHNYSPFLQSVRPGKTEVYGNKGKRIVDLSEGTIIDKYNDMDLTSRTLLSMPFMSSEGGHARIPFFQIAEANDLELYNENISEEVSSTQTYALSYYKEHQNEIDASIPSYAENAAKFFSGDYLTTYMSALGNYMSAFVLGYK